MTEDLSVFFNNSEFAVDATPTLAGGAILAKGTIIYDENGAVVDPMGVQSSSPTALYPLSQWPDLDEGDAISIELPGGTQNFAIRVALPLDDGAIVELTLARI
jgi:hypothetical protein